VPRKVYKDLIEKGLEELSEDEKKNYEEGGRLFDQESNSDAVGEIFQIASDTIAAQRDDHPTKKLFRESNLNFFDPYDWGYLLHLFAHVHYKNKKPGRPKLQVSASQRKLKRHVGELLVGRTRKLNDHPLAKLFLARFAGSYPDVKTVSGALSLFRRHEIWADDLFSGNDRLPGARSRKRPRQQQLKSVRKTSPR
jgi:hypothetical protein